jgi:hypothetical protein
LIVCEVNVRDGSERAAAQTLDVAVEDTFVAVVGEVREAVEEVCPCFGACRCN